MFSKQLESAIASEVAAKQADFVKRLQVSLLAAVNRAFDEIDELDSANIAPPKKALGHQRMTPALFAAIAKKIKNGEPQVAIAEAMGCSVSQVQRIAAGKIRMDRFNGASEHLPKRAKRKERTRVTPEIKQQVIDLLRQDGVTMKEISRRCGLARNTVNRIKTVWVNDELEKKKTEPSPVEQTG